MAAVDWVSRVLEYINATPQGAVRVDPTLGSVQSSVLANLATGVQAEIQRYIGRTLDIQTYTEAYSGQDRSHILLRWDPVVSVTSVAVFGVNYPVYDPTVVPYVFPGNTSVMINVDRNGIQTATTGSWFPLGVQNVLVTYRAGLSPEDDVYQSTVEAGAIWMAAIYSGKDYLAMTSTTTVGGSQTTYKDKMPEYVAQMLGHCQRVARRC